MNWSVRDGERFRLGFAAVGIALVVALGLVLAYEMPGGWADRQLSHGLGVEGTLRIPLGSTPEEAVRQFRQLQSMQVIHEEPAAGGVLLFIKRGYQRDGTDLQIEYVRRTWLGWKWGMGGGFGIGRIQEDRDALSYMMIPKEFNIHAPFPMMFGDVLGNSVQSITIAGTSDAGTFSLSAKLASGEPGHFIWFASLPESLSFPCELRALNGKGELIASKQINGPHDSGLVP